MKEKNFFENVFSFPELSYPETRKYLHEISHFTIGPKGRERCCFTISKSNIKEIDAGWFYTPSVKELRVELQETLEEFEKEYPGYLSQLRLQFSNNLPSLKLDHIIGESTSLHQSNPDALFQAASQFNLLEFPSPSIVPEDGISNYINDHTQGPACAIACLAGTAYRCYLISSKFVDKNKEESKLNNYIRGQTTERQANMMYDITKFITDGNISLNIPSVALDTYYTIHNGYFSSTNKKMLALKSRIELISKKRGISTTNFILELSSLLRIGVVEDTTVTLPLHSINKSDISLHKVTQTYNSAISLSPKQAGPPFDFFASMILVGTYEATLLSGALNVLRSIRKSINLSLPLTEIPPIFLTKVGGGVFHNKPSWIKNAIETSLQSMERYQIPLNVKLVHFKNIEEEYL